MDPATSRKPGDLIIDRYLPNATPEEREEARAALLRYAKILIAIGKKARAMDAEAERVMEPAPRVTMVCGDCEGRA